MKTSYHHFKAAGLLCLCIALASVRAAGATDVRLKLPVNAEVVSEDLTGSAWRQSCKLNVSYAAAVNQIKAVIGQQGWQLTQEMKLGDQNDRSLLVFARGKAEITVMAWKVGVAETGFSWGVNEPKKK